MPPESSISHRNIPNANLPYVSFLSATNTSPCYLPGSADVLTSLKGTAQRRLGFADTVEPTPTTFNNLVRTFTWDRFDGTFLVMFNNINASGQSEVYKMVVGTDASAVLIYTDTGSATPFDFVVSNNTVYFSNGHIAKKYDPVNGVSNWGIAIGSVNNATGPTTAGNGANGAGPNQNWTNPNNVTSAVAYATVSLSLGTFTFSNPLNATVFGFGIPSSTVINGIQVTADVICNDATNNPSFQFHLLKAGSATGTAKTYFSSTTSPITITLGGSSDLWGSTWTPNDINQTNFGTSIVAHAFQVAATNFSIRNVRITVYGTGGPTVTVSASAGTFSATVGYQYVFAYGNSNTGHVSSPTRPSASTGVFTNKLNVQVSLTASTDPQVNQIRVFRSTDSVASGTTAQNYFELPTSPYPNTTANITDNAADTSLIVASIAPTPTFNDPPTPLQGATYFVGRIWGFHNNAVYFSGLEEILLGVPEESFPSGVAGNVWFFDEPVQGLTVIGGGQALAVFCGGRYYAISGNTLDTFRRDLISNRKGCRSVTCTASLGGGYAWLDTSNTIWLGDGAGNATELSEPIRPDLASVTAANCSLCFHTAGTQHWLVFSTGSTLFVYDIDTGQWMPPWTFAATYVYSGEVSPGNYKLMASTGTRAVQLSATAHNDQDSTYTPIFRTHQFSMVPDFGSRFSAAGLGTYDEPSRTAYPTAFCIESNAININDIGILVDDDARDSSAVYTSISSQATTPQVAYNRGQGTKLVQQIWTMIKPSGRWVSVQFKGANADDALEINGFYLTYKTMK